MPAPRPDPLELFGALLQRPPLRGAGNPGSIGGLVGADALLALGIDPTDANLTGGLGGYAGPEDREPQPPADTPAAPIDPKTRALELMAQRDPEVEPVKPEKINPIALILGGLGDALGNRAAVLAGRPSPASTIQRLQDRRREEAETETERRQRQRSEAREDRLLLAQTMLRTGMSEEEARRQLEAENRLVKRETEAETRAVTRAKEKADLDREQKLADEWDEAAYRAGGAGLGPGFLSNYDPKDPAQRREALARIGKAEADREARLKENPDDKFAQQLDMRTIENLELFVSGETGTALEDAYAAAQTPAQKRAIIERTRRTAMGALDQASTTQGRHRVKAILNSDVFPLIKQWEADLVEGGGLQTGGQSVLGGVPGELGRATAGLAESMSSGYARPGGPAAYAGVQGLLALDDLLRGQKEARGKKE